MDKAIISSKRHVGKTAVEAGEMGQDRKMELNEMSVRLLGMIAVKGLPQVNQIAVLSRVGFSPKEIAEVLGTTPNTVRVSLVGIRKNEKQGKRIGLSQKEE